MKTTTCPDCKERIDPNVCWCGDSVNKHYDHSPVEMGCVCYMKLPKSEKKDQDYGS